MPGSPTRFPTGSPTCPGGSGGGGNASTNLNGSADEPMPAATVGDSARETRGAAADAYSGRPRLADESLAAGSQSLDPPSPSAAPAAPSSPPKTAAGSLRSCSVRNGGSGASAVSGTGLPSVRRKCVGMFCHLSFPINRRQVTV